MNDQANAAVEAAEALYVNKNTGEWVRDTEEDQVTYDLVQALKALGKPVRKDSLIEELEGWEATSPWPFNERFARILEALGAR